VGAGVIIAACWLAILLGNVFFGPGPGRRPVSPESIWICVVLITASAALLRMYSKAGIWSLLISLVLIGIVIGAAVVYSYGCPTLFQAMASKNRAYVFEHFCVFFPPAAVAGLILIAAPWLGGIVLGTVFNRWRKSGNRPKELV
jgi:hypothetical protein